MVFLGSHPNVFNICLYILRQRGYTLHIEGKMLEDGTYPSYNEVTWHAEKGDTKFQADNPIELLGLTSVYDFGKTQGEMEPNWWTVSGSDIWYEMMEEAFPDTNSHDEERHET